MAENLKTTRYKAGNSCISQNLPAKDLISNTTVAYAICNDDLANKGVLWFFV
jgi:hypothetical protein